MRLALVALVVLAVVWVAPAASSADASPQTRITGVRYVAGEGLVVDYVTNVDGQDYVVLFQNGFDTRRANTGEIDLGMISFTDYVQVCVPADPTDSCSQVVKVSPIVRVT